MKIKHTLAAIALMMSGSALAQNPYSAYFMDGYAYGHQLNAAKDYDQKSYFGIGVGNINMALRGNLHLEDVFYPNPNGSGLVTFLHPSISADEALSKFKANNKLMMNSRVDLLSFGFHNKRSFQTFTLGVRTDVGANIPYEFFEVTKNLQNKDYNISDMSIHAQSWAEAGWGYSRDITKFLRIGGKLKALIGLGYAKVNLNNLDLDLSSPNQWTITADADAEVGVKNFTWGAPKTEEYSDAYKANHPGATTYECIDFNNVDVDKPGIGGFGLGIDLGAELDLSDLGVPGLKVSAGINDLGFIRWSDVAMAKNKGEQLKFDGFNNIKVSDGTGTALDDQTDDLLDRAADLYALQAQPNGSKTTTPGATLNIGVEYTLPMYKKLAFGALSTTRFQGNFTWSEARISANYHPAKMFEMGVNMGMGSFGTSFGWVVNVHPRGFNLFLSGDHLLSKVSKQWIPLKSNADISVGINFPLGKTNYDRK